MVITRLFIRPGHSSHGYATMDQKRIVLYEAGQGSTTRQCACYGTQHQEQKCWIVTLVALLGVQIMGWSLARKRPLSLVINK